MKFQRQALFIIALIFSSGAAIHAQSSQGVEQLRAQLNEVQAKEAELQARAKELDEELRPENIERSLALTGSTRPEELREQRRRQLQKQRDEVTSQLEQLAASRARLEAAITTAEAAAYRQSAGVPAANPQEQAQGSTNSNQAVKRTGSQQRTRRRRARRSGTRRRS